MILEGVVSEGRYGGGMSEVLRWRGDIKKGDR